MPIPGRCVWFVSIAAGANLLVAAGAAVSLPAARTTDGETCARILPGMRAEEVAAALGGTDSARRGPERAWRGAWGSTAFWRLDRGFLWVRFDPRGTVVSTEYIRDQPNWHRRLRHWLHL